jgi:hypothetical protein
MASFTPSKTMDAKESGNASAAFIADHAGIPVPAAPAVAPPPPPIVITGVTAGAPATLAPPGAAVPADLAALQGDAAIGTVALNGQPTWASGQYITLGDASEAYWDGAAWIAGKPINAAGIGITPAAGLPVTGDATGTQTTTIDIDAHQSIAMGAYTATITYDIGAGDVVTTANITKGMAGAQMANAIATAIDGVAELGAHNVGTITTVTPTDSTVLSKLTLTIA